MRDGRSASSWARGLRFEEDPASLKDSASTAERRAKRELEHRAGGGVSERNGRLDRK